MAAARPLAFVVHSSAGRARLRLPEQQGNAGFFETLSSALEKHPSVVQVRASAHTASVLVLHTGDFQGVVAHAQKRGLFEVAPPPPPAASFRRIRDAIDSMDDRVAKSTGDTLSVGKLLWVALVGAGIFQSNRGHMLPAGVTLFKHALELIGWVAEREPINSQHRA